MCNRKFNKSLSLVVALIFIAATVLISIFPTTVEAADGIIFTNVTDTAGLYYRNETWGWAWGDYDADGYIDLFLGQDPAATAAGTTIRNSALMRNNGNGTFTDKIVGSGIGLAVDRHDQAWVDYDDDGDLDLWISVGSRSTTESPSELFANNSETYTFSDVAAAAGVDNPTAYGVGSAWLDYDLDGDLDLFFTESKQEGATNAFFRNDGDGSFTNIGEDLGLYPPEGVHGQVSVADYDADGDQDVFLANGVTQFYRNDGDTFTSVGADAGVVIGSGAQAAAWGDYDNDGDPDLFVSRGAMDNSADYQEYQDNQILFNAQTINGDEDGIDFQTSSGANVAFEIHERVGDVIDDGIDFIYVGEDALNPAANPFTLSGSETSDAPSYVPGEDNGVFIWQLPEGTWHIRWTSTSTTTDRFSGIITASDALGTVTEIDFEAPKVYDMPNKLYQNNGDGTFTEVGSTAGVADIQDCRSADWGDYDNDGDLDLFVQTAGTLGTNASDLLYLNNGNGTFTNVASEVGISGTLDGYGWGAIWADYDNDGFLDMLTSHDSWQWPLDQGRYELFHNEGNQNHWLQIDLQGVESSWNAFGAKLWLTAGGETQYREIGDNSHYYQHYTGPVHFGLGSSTVIDELKILWPSGLEQVIENLDNLAVDQKILIVEGEQPVEPTPDPTETPEPSEAVSFWLPILVRIPTDVTTINAKGR